ncbi:ABC transporter substrate-binding protein [Virgibacillus sp. JSM 102003]|uniref:ABC transporter substrate-binding protein n=1 Tax=Virgibacillus sp. JSM 102003 TaxID=1562108 RepID=UPI0035BF4951
MVRKIWYFALLMVSILLLISGCSNDASGSNNEGNNNQIELSFLHKWPEPEYAPFFEKVVKQYEKENPNIKIDMNAIGDNAMKDKLRTTIGGGDAPDIVFTWSGQFVQKFIDAGVAMDLSGYFSEDEKWSENFISASLQPFKSGDKIYGVPIRLIGKFFVYNKEIFNEYGLDVPTTWNEFTKVNEELKENGITPIGLGNEHPWASIHYLTGLNQEMVPQEVLEKDYNPETSQFEHEGYVKALEYLIELNENGYFNDNINATSHSMAKENFIQGNSAMVYVETEEFIQINNSLEDEWGIFTLPEIKSGEGEANYVTGAPDGFLVSDQSEHPDEAVDFLKFLTSKETQEMMVDMVNWTSGVKGAVNEENALPQSSRAQEIIEEAEGLSQWLDTAVASRVADVYLTNLQPLLNGEKTPEEVMEEVRTVAKEVREK